jgi:non-ribosomal peptide synthetase component F
MPHTKSLAVSHQHSVWCRVKEEHLVAIRLSRSLAVAVAVLGVLKARAAFVPIDPDLPQGA